MLKTRCPQTKKRIPPDRGMRYDIIHNSYGSTNCIRFEGIISANEGTPLLLQIYTIFLTSQIFAAEYLMLEIIICIFARTTIFIIYVRYSRLQQLLRVV